MTASAALVVAACLAGAVACVAAGAGRERRLWWGMAALLVLFGLHKLGDGQGAAIARLHALATAGGWYGERRPAQWAVVALVAAIGLGAAVLIRFGARRLTVPARTALALAALLGAYVLLGAISLHAWDRLVSMRILGVDAFTLVETALPLLIGACALVARRRHG